MRFASTSSTAPTSLKLALPAVCFRLRMTWTWRSSHRRSLIALVKEAHELRRKTAAHAHGAEGAKRAIRAGIDSIEHGTFLDDECVPHDA